MKTMSGKPLKSPLALGALLAMPLLLAGCEIGSKETSQWGPRGAGMEGVVNPRVVSAPGVPPESPYPLENRDGPRARDSYENLQVLGDISTEEFNLLMINITAWVAPPELGCNYCHNPENMASDEVYQKVVARKMLQMNRTINTTWTSHVKQTGVTCYTCHRGKGVPDYYWTNAPARPSGILGNNMGQNKPSPTVAYSSLPHTPFEKLLVGDEKIRVSSKGIHPTADNTTSIQATEATYGLMMHMSSSLGVNCTFCHNTQNFGAWSREQRVGAWYGIRMVRNINDDYITPLKGVFPAHRLGPTGDPFKVNCETCHQGANKPLGGVSMLADNPSLRDPNVAVAANGTTVLAASARTPGTVRAVAVTMPTQAADAVALVASSAADRVRAAAVTEAVQ